MLELASSVLASLGGGHRLAVATVVGVDGSAPRALGTSMAVDDEGRVIGSISGGCVEGAVYEACERVLASGVAELCEFGFSDADAFAVGLACGGRLRVFVQEFGLPDARNALSGPVRDELERARDGRAAGLALVMTGDLVDVLAAKDGPEGSVVRARVLAALDASVHAGRSVRRRVECDGETVEAVFLVSAPPPRMIIFGAVDFSVALSNAAALLGYRVTVCDARPVFATPERFPSAEVVNQWPSDYLAQTAVDERTALCILTHDDKFDIPLLEVALALPVAYVGAMGSRVTHDRRVRALLDRGLDPAALDSLHSPIGLDIGASSPEETAVSILSEILAVRTRRSGASLRTTEGPIHRPSAVEAANEQ
ncbi:XdhC family protein [Herbiconiux ginsengi]|uniref:Xanthine dehydrogenase accessory factor n=1 Tax=Herbiconiux ginsengi TaxID=381665 RepID=A0A1H3SAF3_9MICO|nr:XdhC/CoxI family protein [Herbiconiux ginsengi]SDZ34650.1 xanthine dehydrogenase accessory factor [Herbiconiux ginsengi]